VSETSTIVTPLFKALNSIPGVLCLRILSGMAPTKGGYIRGNEKGTFDLLALLPSPLFMECKLPGEKASKEQLQFLGRLKRMGVEGIFVFSVHEGIEAVRKRIQPQPEQKELFP